MSGGNTQAASETANTKFARVDGKAETNGPLTIIKASELAAAGITGVVAQGNLIRSVQNQFGKTDYVLATDKGDMIINGCGSLDKQMAAVEVGELIQIEYSGKFPMKNGKFKGTPSHVFVVRRASSETESAS